LERFFSAFVDAGASDETLTAACASLRLGVGRPFFWLFSGVEVMGKL
jgi:hypothetical protein